jgi:hypothetical protein
MLQVFYLDVTYVSNDFSSVFLRVFQTHVSSVSSVFFCMLQMFHLDIPKVDWDIGYVAMVLVYVPKF